MSACQLVAFTHTQFPGQPRDAPRRRKRTPRDPLLGRLLAVGGVLPVAEPAAGGYGQWGGWWPAEQPEAVPLDPCGAASVQVPEQGCWACWLL